MGKEKLTIAVVLGDLVLTGCASSLVGANEAGGMIHVGVSDGAAFDMASGHCQRFGKVPRVTRAPTELTQTMTFDCVAP